MVYKKTFYKIVLNDALNRLQKIYITASIIHTSIINDVILFFFVGFYVFAVVVWLDGGFRLGMRDQHIIEGGVL